MKPLNRILVVPTLLLFATANTSYAAVVASFDVNEVDTFSFPLLPPGTMQSASGSGRGTATLDDSGLITMHLTDTSTIYWKDWSVNNDSSYIYTSTADTTISGIWDGGIFTPISGSPNWTSCVDSGIAPACATVLPLGQQGAASLRSVDGALAISGGTLTLELFEFGYLQSVQSTYTFAPTVPLPASVWLFCSGLLGLANLTRQKLKADH